MDHSSYQEWRSQLPSSIRNLYDDGEGGRRNYVTPFDYIALWLRVRETLFSHFEIEPKGWAVDVLGDAIRHGLIDEATALKHPGELREFMERTPRVAQVQLGAMTLNAAGANFDVNGRTRRAIEEAVNAAFGRVRCRPAAHQRTGRGKGRQQ